jgi:hypothetical protein
MKGVVLRAPYITRFLVEYLTVLVGRAGGLHKEVCMLYNQSLRSCVTVVNHCCAFHGQLDAQHSSKSMLPQQLKVFLPAGLPEMRYNSTMTYDPARRLVELKSAFLKTWPMVFDSDEMEIAETNRVGLGVEASGIMLYPAFQLDENRKPYPALKQILKIASDRGVEDWSVALWFDTPSPHDSFKRKPADYVDQTEHIVECFRKDTEVS